MAKTTMSEGERASNEPSPEAKAARGAVAALFALNGVLFATWVSRIPAIEAAHGLTHDRLGLALLALALGAMASMPSGGWLAERFGSHRVCQVGTALFCLALPPPALAPSFASLAGFLFLLGASHGALDVSMNAQAVAVEQRYGRPIMSSFHALFSFGGMVGAGLGGLMAWAGISPIAHFAGVSLLLGGVTSALTFPRLLANDPPAAKTLERNLAKPPFRWPPAAIWVLGAAAFCVLLGEGAMSDWSALFLRDVAGTGEGLAAAGYAAFSVAMAAGRFAGDELALRFGPVRLVRWGGVLAAVGLGLALLAASPWLSLLGFVGVGAGFATVVPQIFTAAGNMPGMKPAPALAAVTSMGYLGFLLGPPLIGFAASQLGLRNALGLVILASGLLALFAPWLKAGARRGQPERPGPRERAEASVAVEP